MQPLLNEELATLSAINSVHQANAQAISQVRHLDQASSEERQSSDSNRIAQQEAIQREQTVESLEESVTEDSLDKLV